MRRNKKNKSRYPGIFNNKGRKLNSNWRKPEQFSEYPKKHIIKEKEIKSKNYENFEFFKKCLNFEDVFNFNYFENSYMFCSKPNIFSTQKKSQKRNERSAGTQEHLLLSENDRSAEIQEKTHIILYIFKKFKELTEYEQDLVIISLSSFKNIFTGKITPKSLLNLIE